MNNAKTQGNMNGISGDIADESPDAIANRLINRAEYRDGLQEIAIGVFILFAGMMLSPVVFRLFVYKSFYWGGLLLIPISFGSQWAIRKVRGRYLIGKVGYVKLKPVNQKRLGIRLGIVFGFSFVIAALAAIVAFKAVAIHRGGGMADWGSLPPLRWLILGTGIFNGAIMIFRVRLLRYVIGGVIMTAMGILLAFSGVSLNVSLAILYGFAGLLPVISGCVVFFLFIREHNEAGE